MPEKPSAILAHGDVVAAIQRLGGRVTARQVAEELDISLQGAAARLRSLRVAGYVQFFDSPGERPVRYVLCPVEGLRAPRHQDWTAGIPVETDVHRDDTLMMRGADYIALRQRLVDAEVSAEFPPSGLSGLSEEDLRLLLIWTAPHEESAVNHAGCAVCPLRAKLQAELERRRGGEVRGGGH